MADEGLALASRYGQDLGAGAEEALYLKVFSQEVLLAFERHAVTNGRVRTRSISSGKSAQFPLVGAMSSSYHTPGENILQEGGATSKYLSNPEWSEKVISIDGILQSSVLISEIDDAMSHYDVRGPYAREMGWSLARQFDVNTLWTMVTGAEASATIDETLLEKSDWGKGGNVTVTATFNSDVAVTRSEMERIAQLFDVNDVPSEGRHCAVDPVTFYLLAAEDDIVSADFNQTTKGDRGMGGSQPELFYAGLHVHKTNRLTDLRAQGTKDDQQLGTDYTGTLAAVTGVFWQQDWSVGVVKLKELGMRSEFQLPYLATLLVGGFSVGHGVLHESACAAILSA